MIVLTKTKEQAEKHQPYLLSDGARAAWIQGLGSLWTDARAYTNIALIKYWGKQDETFFYDETIVCPDPRCFYTETTVAFSPDFTQDRFYIDGVMQTDAAADFWI